jgi:protein phosphatase 1 regulatory subunit 7
MSEPEKTNNNDETQKEVKEEEAKEEKPIIKKVVPPELPLDWTKLGHDEGEEMRVRYPEDVAEINAVDLDICIVGTAGQKITVISNEFYKQCNPDLESLVLRSHLIQCIQGIQGFKKLHLLELYDNQVQELSCLEVPGPNLGVLDMSYNAIRDLSPVGLCVNLTELCKFKSCMLNLVGNLRMQSALTCSAILLDIANNKLKQITGLKGLANLRKIDLGANRIRVMDEEELGGLINLEELWIGKNKIEQIQGLEKVQTFAISE